MAEVARRAGFPASDADGSVAEWLAVRLGERPAPGVLHVEHGFEFSVRRVRRGRIFEVQMAPCRAARPAR